MQNTTLQQLFQMHIKPLENWNIIFVLNAKGNLKLKRKKVNIISIIYLNRDYYKWHKVSECRGSLVTSEFYELDENLNLQF